MATNIEWYALIAQCDWQWTSVQGVQGYKIRNKYEGNNTIFLPAAGYKWMMGTNNVGSDGKYWTSTVYFYSAYSLDFYEGNFRVDPSYYRAAGLSVRPVSEGY